VVYANNFDFWGSSMRESRDTLCGPAPAGLPANRLIPYLDLLGQARSSQVC
jgi:hypothetical protein